VNSRLALCKTIIVGIQEVQLSGKTLFLDAIALSLLILQLSYFSGQLLQSPDILQPIDAQGGINFDLRA